MDLIRIISPEGKSYILRVDSDEMWITTNSLLWNVKTRSRLDVRYCNVKLNTSWQKGIVLDQFNCHWTFTFKFLFEINFAFALAISLEKPSRHDFNIVHKNDYVWIEIWTQILHPYFITFFFLLFSDDYQRWM